jgi:hypothetical protein
MQAQAQVQRRLFSPQAPLGFQDVEGMNGCGTSRSSPLWLNAANPFVIFPPALYGGTFNVQSSQLTGRRASSAPAFDASNFAQRGSI